MKAEIDGLGVFSSSVSENGVSVFRFSWVLAEWPKLGKEGGVQAKYRKWLELLGDFRIYN
jgi:hypothetical protein